MHINQVTRIMIQSMTGYGKASCEIGEKTATFQIKTLNSKQLDLYFRLPNGYRDKEMDMRNELISIIKRGKAEINLRIDYKEGKQATQINAGVVREYYNQLKSICRDSDLPLNEPILQAVLRLPESLNSDKESVDSGEAKKLMQTLKYAAGNSINSEAMKERHWQKIFRTVSD